MNFEVAHDTNLVHKIMEKRITVKIEKTKEGYVVSNDLGVAWTYLAKYEVADESTKCGMSSLAVSLLTATVMHQFAAAESAGKNIEFKLSMKTYK